MSESLPDSPTRGPVRRRRLSTVALLVWLAAYAATMAVVVYSVLAVRNNVLRDMDTAEARAEWQAWREAEPNQPGKSPVSRRPPSTIEPPAVVLLRDHFAVMMAAAVFFSSLLFGATMFTAQGVLSSRRSREPRP